VTGTLRNPRQVMGGCGFDGDANRKMGAMLSFAAVNAPRRGPGSRGVRPGVRTPLRGAAR